MSGWILWVRKSAELVEFCGLKSVVLTAKLILQISHVMGGFCVV